MRDRLRIVIAWKGLPAYGAVCIANALRNSDQEITVIATPATVPVVGLEKCLGRKPIWISDETSYGWGDLNLEAPDIFFETGWATPAFNSLRDEVKVSGGKVVCFMDNCYKGNLRQLCGAFYFRVAMKSKFDYFWVPGVSGARFARLLGMPSGRVLQGLYGCDRSIFTSKKALIERPKTIVFIGQFIRRKGILEIRDAFLNFHRFHPEWELRYVGCGPLEGEIRGYPGIHVSSFVQSGELAQILSESRMLILNSYEEHWGVVVHEATSAGCGLILSKNVGSAADLATDDNAILYDGNSVASVGAALLELDRKDAAWYEKAGKRSIELAANFGPDRWAREFSSIIESAKKSF